MTPIFDGLELAPCGDIGTLVYVGAGEGQQLSLMLPFAARRIVLAEGDPTALAELQTNAAAFPLAEVHGVVLSPRDGYLCWHRYNLAWLNGPYDMSALSSCYPRLRTKGVADVPAQALDGWLRGLGIAVDAAARNLLVLDLPGQEAMLLASLSTATIQLFEWIVVRACAFDSDPARVFTDGMRRLEEAGFQLSRDTVRTEPLWPVVLAEFDAAGWQLVTEARLRAEQDAHLRARLSELDALVAAEAHTRKDLQLRSDGLTDALDAARAQSEQREQAHRAALRTSESAAAEALARMAQEAQANLEATVRQLEQAHEQERRHVHEARVAAEADVRKNLQLQIDMLTEALNTAGVQIEQREQAHRAALEARESAAADAQARMAQQVQANLEAKARELEQAHEQELRRVDEARIAAEADADARRDLQLRIDGLTESLEAARTQIEQREQAHRAALRASESAAADAQARMAQQAQANLEAKARELEQAQEQELRRVDEARIAADARRDLQLRIDGLTESLEAAKAQIEQREQAHRAALQACESAAADAQARRAHQTQARLEDLARQLEQTQERERQRVQEELFLAQAREEETAKVRVQLTEAAAREAALMAKIADAAAGRAAVAESLQAQIRRTDNCELQARALAAEGDAVRRDTADLKSKLGDAGSRIDVLAVEAVSLREQLAISQRDGAARVATMSAECDAARRAASDVQFQLSESRTRQDSLTAESASLREQLTVALQSHSQVLRDAEAARREVDAVRHDADNRLREAAKRELGLRDEIVRAEAQLDLVKDLLLREPGL